MSDANADKYTKPALRDRLKASIQRGSKGGRPGQWSARKSQLLVAEYKKQGGGFKGPKDERQKGLEKWTAEEWQTQSGSAAARHGKTTDRYLPKKAWSKLTPAERKATDEKKRAASRKGKQFVANTAKAKRARRSASGTGRKKSAAA